MLFGVLSILILALGTSLIFSLVLQFTETQEHSISTLVTVLSFLAVFAGGFISGGKHKQKGWMIGGTTGLLYSLIILLYHYLGHNMLFSFEQVIYHVCYIITAMMGGVLGVNIVGGPSYSK